MNDSAAAGRAVSSHRRLSFTRRHWSAAPSTESIERLAMALVVLTLLQVMIGDAPYRHGASLGAAAGRASPVRADIWIALLGLAGPLLWLRRRALALMSRRIWPLLALTAWFVASAAWAVDQDASLRRLSTMVVGVAICAACSLGLKDGRRMHAAIALACALMTAIDLGSWIAMPALSMTPSGLAGIHADNIAQGSVALSGVLAMGTYALAARDGRHRLAWAAMTLAAAAVLVASRSSVALGLLAAIAVAGPLLATILRRRFDVMVAWMAILLCLPTALAFIWIAWNYSRAQDPFAFLGRIAITQSADMWRSVIRQVGLHPLRGLGFGSFWDADPAARPDAPSGQAHNGYIDLLMTTGAIGLGGALIVLFRWMARGLMLLRQSLAPDGSHDSGHAAYAAFLCLFTLVTFADNGLQSSDFTTAAVFAIVMLFVGIEIDWRIADWPGRGSPPSRQPGATQS